MCLKSFKSSCAQACFRLMCGNGRKYGCIFSFAFSVVNCLPCRWWCQWFSGICVCTKWYPTPHSFLHSLNHCTWMVAQSLLLNQEIWRRSNIPRWRSTFAKLFALNLWWRFTSPYDHLVEFGTSWEVAFMDNLGCMRRQGIPPCQVSCPPIGAKWWCMDGRHSLI